MRFHAITGLVAAILLAGCASRPLPPAPPPVRAPAPAVTPPAAVAPSPAAYVAAAGSADLFIVRASELALQRLGPGAEHRRAEMMIGEHQGMSAQLSISGRRLNLLPSATLLPRHQGRLAALQGSTSFAADYRRQLLAVHEELLRLHGAMAATGSSPTLRPVASAAAARVRAHLIDLR